MLFGIRPLNENPGSQIERSILTRAVMALLGNTVNKRIHAYTLITWHPEDFWVVHVCILLRRNSRLSSPSEDAQR